MAELSPVPVPAPPQAPEDLGWALATLLRAHVTHVGAELADVPGGPRGYLVLSVAADGSCSNQAEIAARLGLDRTALTYLVDGLERADLVRRTPDPVDRRARHVDVTDAGATVLAAARERVEAAERRLLAGLPTGAAEDLRSGLLRAARLAEGAPETGGAGGVCSGGAVERCGEGADPAR